MNRTQNHRIWRRVLLATAGLVAVLGLTGAACTDTMNTSIDQHYYPAVIQARDAAEIASQCGAGIGTPAQVAAAAATADSARRTASELRYLMEDLKEAYADRLRATDARIAAAQMSDAANAQIAEYQRRAGLALVESGVDHDIDFMFTLGLPPLYNKPTPERPNISAFGNTNHLLIATAYQDMTEALRMAQLAFDSCSTHPLATPSEITQLGDWLNTAKSVGGVVTSAHGTGQSLLYQTPDDVTQSAVRNAYKAMEMGFRARALQLTIEMRADGPARERAAGLHEAEEIARYTELLARAGEAQRRAQDAANAAYRAANDCGIDTAPIVPGSPEWNSTFWQVSSP